MIVDTTVQEKAIVMGFAVLGWAHGGRGTFSGSAEVRCRTRSARWTVVTALPPGRPPAFKRLRRATSPVCWSPSGTTSDGDALPLPSFCTDLTSLVCNHTPHLRGVLRLAPVNMHTTSELLFSHCGYSVGPESCPTLPLVVFLRRAMWIGFSINGTACRG